MYVSISIGEEDLELIMGKAYGSAYPAALQSAHCPRCRLPDNAELLPERLWLNPAGDVLVQGACRQCGGAVEKLIETGIDPVQFDQAMAIRDYKIEISKDYEVKV
ncbi:hypothetical protein [Phaeodactylibacter luteus]|uniref:Uncharacterized protein n=1 Tax=Phaeodactylibacter luteus TaxID=1564516 RepID=A0A5C6RMR0_9BACT|nr:hypothetical protein [Phaeodactylibacter luteus]TXB62930.1 hypothetical protein FRY97_11340 [Phaeodactylibacter luteus]